MSTKIVNILAMPLRRHVPTWQQLEECVGIQQSRQLLVGIDEVGRGAWAGPVVAGAAVLSYGSEILELGDSKVLSAATRRRVHRRLKREAVALGLGWVSAAEIDEHGLSWAVRTSGLRALTDLMFWSDLEPTTVILDGSHNYLGDDPRATAIVAADALIPSVAAASVVAKQARDTYMASLEKSWPDYGFSHHVGYGTNIHRKALNLYGATPFHRQSFAPLKRLII